MMIIDDDYPFREKFFKGKITLPPNNHVGQSNTNSNMKMQG